MIRVYWDSMLFIYMLEANPTFGPKVRKILQQTVNRGDTVCTSIFSLGEVLTGPQRKGSQSGVEAIKRYFLSGAVEILPFTEAMAERYSLIRATHRISQADGIHIAAAAEAGVDIFFTNDIALRRLSIPGIKFFADLDGKVI
ncbi:MAG: type II toxin-antitoxin system VapC family toxin [Acidobacteriota bacterium]